MQTQFTLEFKETKLGFTVGDVNGIGLEVMLKAFSSEYLFNHCTPVLYGTAESFKYYCKALGIDGLRYNLITDTSEAKPGVINLKDVGVQVDISPGTPSKETGKLALKALTTAVEDIKNGQIHNLVTLPIDKNSIQSEEFHFSGHTDYLASTFECDEYMMLLVDGDLRVGVVTGHIPITQVSKALTPDLIKQKISILLDSLRFDYGINKPKVAVLGLNPHSGDNGLIGSEEGEVLKPVLDEFVGDGELVFGPYAADGFFGTKAYENFDAVLAMYHDQGLVPFKQLAFDTGVNYTAGLPIVRTSPDHGTAYDIAGKNQASVTSLVSAVFEAKKIYSKRMESNELRKNPLTFKSHRKEKFSIGVPNLK